MKRMTWNVVCAASVLACALIAACGDDSSTSPQETNVQSSSSVSDNPNSNALDVSSSSGPVSSAMLSSAVESSSSKALPTTLCLITMKTMTGYYPKAYTKGTTKLCLPLENCDLSSVNMGFTKCYGETATVEGCYTEASAEVVDACDKSLDETCETQNGTAYIFGRFNVSCGSILR